jgi:hypothetical protein
VRGGNRVHAHKKEAHIQKELGSGENIKDYIL